MTLFSFVLFSRSEVEAIILRTPGQIYQKVDEQTYSNVYNFKLINKTPYDKTYRLKLIEPTQGRLEKAGASKIKANASELAEGAFIIFLKRSDMKATQTDVVIGVYDDDKLITTVETGFTGPLRKPTK
ncbi:MAG: FixG Ig-like domain-containing protein [Owenweeksia sp.]|nr:FixG Ig-like domain-containing protein [Owenweeksia sp.]